MLNNKRYQYNHLCLFFIWILCPQNLWVSFPNGLSTGLHQLIHSPAFGHMLRPKCWASFWILPFTSPSISRFQTSPVHFTLKAQPTWGQFRSKPLFSLAWTIWCLSNSSQHPLFFLTFHSLHILSDIFTSLCRVPPPAFFNPWALTMVVEREQEKNRACLLIFDSKGSPHQP